MTGTIFSDEPILLGDAIRHYMTDTDNQELTARPTALDEGSNSTSKTLVLTTKRSPTPMSLSDAILYIEHAYGTIDQYVASELVFEDVSIDEMSLGHLLDEGARQRTAWRNRVLAAASGDIALGDSLFQSYLDDEDAIVKTANAADLIAFTAHIEEMARLKNALEDEDMGQCADDGIDWFADDDDVEWD